ncbi:Pectic acid lyase [Pirellulimonas nuda]|uniref:Pectic acid lyase n=1 Tax=Pirellulimonas nuda TaxID=2528009 RepID=A0A518DCJ7_9BACT|nr:pectate lyase [Pirellulimonas nuda]QDU89204.1 Pectic acid lyase [Pirellulimonas nuda]
MLRHCCIALLALLSFTAPLLADTAAAGLAKKPDSWFQSDDGRQTLEHILSWQTEQGDWPKNTDTTRKAFSGDRAKLRGTFDNGATSGELRLLARAFRATGDQRYEKAFLTGFDHILRAQYPNGGWPQYYPLSKQYHRHITFNDGSMIRIMEFLRDATTAEDFAFLDEGRRAAAEKALERGVDCIVKCQVVVDGRPTVWCAQHDEVSLAATSARSYELASLSGAESAGVLIFLMNLDQPSPDVVRAVNSGVAWFDGAKIEGYRYVRSGGERKLQEDPSAGPLWARFYEIKSNRPFFCDRDGVVKYQIEQIGAERRNGYAWYGNWGEKVAKAYSKWPHR